MTSQNYVYEVSGSVADTMNQIRTVLLQCEKDVIEKKMVQELLPKDKTDAFKIGYNLGKEDGIHNLEREIRKTRHPARSNFLQKIAEDNNISLPEVLFLLRHVLK